MAPHLFLLTGGSDYGDGSGGNWRLHLLFCKFSELIKSMFVILTQGLMYCIVGVEGWADCQSTSFTSLLEAEVLRIWTIGSCRWMNTSGFILKQVKNIIAIDFLLWQYYWLYLIVKSIEHSVFRKEALMKWPPAFYVTS